MAAKKPVKAVAVKKVVKKPAPAKAPTTAELLGKVGIDVICARVADCHFLENIASDCGVSRGSLVKWLSSVENAALYACAREAQADKMAEDILRIADDGANDTYQTENGEATNHDVIARSRLRVDARKWLAAKMAPKKYGEKLAVVGDPLNPIETRSTLNVTGLSTATLVEIMAAKDATESR